MYFLSLPIALRWEPAFLHIVDTWLSNFSWLSILIPSNVTECSDVIFILTIYISCLFSIFPNLFIIIAWNLPGFTVMKLSLNHSAISASFWRVSFNNVMSFSKAVIVLSSVKLYNEDFYKKPIKSFLNMLNSKVPRINPWETQESSVWKVLCMLFKLTHCFLRFK